MPTWKNSKLLIWGTTYPEFSKSYYETVCTGAVDEATGKLVRIYPVTLRYQNEPIRHYRWVEAEIQRNSKDRRPESFRIRQDDIKVLGKLETKDGWVDRSKWVLRDKNITPSVEALWEAQDAKGTSLALVKPKAIKRVFVKKLPASDRVAWEKQREAALKQRDLFVSADKVVKDLVFMPVRYHVVFECHGDGCRGHDMSVLDWGTYVLSRRLYAQKGPRQAEAGVIAKIEEITDLAKKDAYLFLGNTLAHPQSFMIVGFYFPPLKKPSLMKKSRPSSPQFGLPGID